MIVGTTSINIEALIKNSGTVTQFENFCESLVPEEFRHIRTIIDNQKYLCCMIYRKLENVTWSRKKELLNEVLRGLRIVGLTDMLVEASSLIGMINRERIEKFKELGL